MGGLHAKAAAWTEVIWAWTQGLDWTGIVVSIVLGLALTALSGRARRLAARVTKSILWPVRMAWRGAKWAYALPGKLWRALDPKPAPKSGVVRVGSPQRKEHSVLSWSPGSVNEVTHITRPDPITPSATNGAEDWRALVLRRQKEAKRSVKPYHRAPDFTRAPWGMAIKRPIPVQATKTGFYDHAIRRPGDIFELDDESHFAIEWMKRMDGKEST